MNRKSEINVVEFERQRHRRRWEIFIVILGELWRQLAHFRTNSIAGAAFRAFLVRKVRQRWGLPSFRFDYDGGNGGGANLRTAKNSLAPRAKHGVRNKLIFNARFGTRDK